MISEKKKSQINKHNKLRSACVLWVRQNQPELFAAIQQILGISSKDSNDEIYGILQQANEIVNKKTWSE